MALTVNDLRKKYYESSGRTSEQSGNKTVDDLRKQYYSNKKTEALSAPTTPSATQRQRAESREEERSKTSGFEVTNPLTPVQKQTVQNSNRRFQTVAERAENKPASTNVRAKGNSGGDTTSRVGKGLQSIGLNTAASAEYLIDTGKVAAKNQKEYANSMEKQLYAEALSNFNMVRSQYTEGTPEYQEAWAQLQKAQADLDKVGTATVDPNSRSSQFMAGVQQLQEDALEGTSGVGRFLGETALSIGSNVAKLPMNAILPGSSLALMGAEAAANKAYELQQQGVSAGEALGRGLVSGGIEALTEKIGLDNLMDLVKTGGKSVLMNIAKQALAEGGEEGLSYVLNYMADEFAGDPEASFVLNDFAKSIGMGALSGGLFGAGGTALYALGSQTADADPVMDRAMQLMQEHLGIPNAETVLKERQKPVSQHAGIPQQANAMQDEKSIVQKAKGQQAQPVAQESASGRDAKTVAADVARVEEYATALGENGSNALRSVYGSQEISGKYAPEDIVHGFYDVYNEAMTGKTMSAEAKLRADALPENVRFMAESSGKEDARRAVQAKYFGKDAKLVRDDNWKKANLSFKTSRKLDTLAKVLGVQVRFVDKIVVDQEGHEANAQYQNGEILISRNTDLPVMTAAIHESVHRLREASPEAYTELSSFVLANMSELGRDFNLAYRSELYQTGNRDVLTEEMVADAYGMMLENSGMLDKMAREHTTVLQRLADSIRDILRSINKAVSLEDLHLTQEEKDTFFELRGQLRGMENAMRNALKAVEKSGSQAYNNGNNAKLSRKESQYGREENRGNEEAGRETESDARGTDTVQRAVRRVHGKEDGMVRHSKKGERPVISWKPGEIIAPANGTVAYDEAQTVESYNVSCFVIRDAAWDAYWAGAKKIPPALASGGQVYLRATIPADVRGMVAPHELTHVMKQAGFQPYLDFINRTLKHLNQQSVYTQQMLTNVADQRGIVLKPKMDRKDIVDWYDEFHANIYGEIAANTTGDVRWVLDQVFQDFDAYAAELTELHRQFKASQTGAKFSLKDSEGRKLSEEQQAFFAHSKVRDAEGRLTPVYHGTPNGGFTEFKLPQYLSTLMAARGAGYYFTDKKNARQYMKPVGKTGGAPNKQLYKVYLNITNPLVIAHDSEVSITKEQFKEIVRRGNYEWFRTNGLPHQVRGDKTANKALPYEELLDKWADQVIGAAYYDEDILSEMVRAYTGETNDILVAMQDVLGYDGVRYTDSYGDIWVAWDNSQIKNVDNLTPTSSSDIRYSLKREKEVGIAYDAKTESVNPQYSLKTWKASSYVQAKKETAKEMSKALGITEKKALAYIDSVNSIAKIIADDKVRLDYEASPGRSSFVGNTEYGGSIDFSTVCKKRRLFTGTFEAIQKALPNTALTADEFLEIRSMMDKKGYEVSCGLCYVEGSRANMGQYAKQFLDEYKATNPKYVPNMAEINTPNGLEKIRMEHPEVYAAYEKFMNGLAQRKPKLYQLHTEYQGEILNKFRKKNSSVETKNQNGGLRIQSFSDFEIVHLLDMMQVIMDMSQVGLAGQAYTKVPDFAWALGDTGLKINLSLIAKGVDSKGRLILDEKEGMAEKDAMALRERYSDNVGTIIVVFTDRQLKAAMADERIDYIIPFHRSQWNSAQYEAMGLPANAKDFTLWQNESYIQPVYNKNGKKQRPSNYMPNNYWDFSKSGKENAEAYLKMCAENNRRPKFHYLLVNNGDGSYSLQPDGSTDGYWKTLIDFKMYDNNGKGSPQMPVRPNFNMEQAERMLREYTGGHGSFPAAQDVVDEFVAKYRENHPGQQHSRSNRELLNNMIKQYGAIPRGEKPARDVLLPTKTASGKNVSRTVRTILEAEATPDAMIPDVEALVAEGALSFESYTDDQAIADATAKLQTRGWSNTLSKWISDVDKGVVTKENTVTGWALYNNAANKGDVETALTILQKMVGHQRNAAQALQATRVLKKLSPDAQLYGVQRSVQDLQDELNKKYGDDKAPQLKIDPELGEKFMRAETDAERDEVMGEIYRDVGKQMPSTFRDKWNAWRYLAMLGNARTHVRNIVGNAGFAPVVGIKNITATGIEALVSGVSGGKIGRTKAITADKAMLKAAWEDYGNVADEISNGGKYIDFQNANKQIEAGRVIFKNKALEKARTFNSAAMEKEDAWFSKPHYAAALASYCKANGITAQQVAKGGKAMDKARAYAIKEAQKATYRDTNALSQAFGEIGGKWRTSSNPVKKGVGIAIEGILPFRKTPANILARGVEYSPIGLMNGIKKAVWDVQKGNATASEAVDNISAGLTGSMLMALGAFLAAQGLIRGGGEGDDKEKEFAELQGHQTYAMELPNGKSVTLDWLAPEALPFFIGVNFFESTQGKKEEMDIDSIIGSVTSITEPLLEMSCLQGLNDLIDSVGYASGRDVNSLVAMAASAATSYLTQALPTLGGQLERSFQKERMTTYSDKNKRWIPADLQYTIGKATAKIPGLDYQQIPYIDAWGRTESTGNFAENAFGNLLNPSYTSQIDTTAMEDELLRLYRSTGESVFPSRAARYFMVNNERKDLTAEEYVQYATLKGRYSYELLTELVDSSTYKSLTDVEKAKMVSEVFDNANKQAKAAISEYKLDEWAAKYAEAEKKYGIKQEVFAEVRMNTRFLASLKDKNGETITNSLSLLKMEAVYNIPGLTDKQRQALFDYLDVGKSVRHYNKSLVKQKLTAMRKNAK